MPARIPDDIAEHILSTHPLPIADAVSALVAADSAFEQRDRVVEVFRATLRTLSALALAARVQFGPGPGAEPAQIAELIRSLRGRGLTDGQWFAILREMLRPWAGAPGSYPLPALVTLVHGKKAELPKLVDELLVMRKSETVAHGASGTRAAISEILDRRVPQLVRLLTLLDPLWASTRLLVPLAKPDDESEPQPAWSLMGYTPPRGRWRRVTLAPGIRLSPGEAVLSNAEHQPVLALHPLILVRRPSPEAIEELFTLDGGSKKGAVFVALPSMAEHRETEAWTALSKALANEETSPLETAASGLERPFRGLSSFGPEHTALFFGREEQTQSLANRIRRHPFVTVTGPSGCGKTSLLRAGALPRLEGYRTVVLRPGTEPMDSLAHRLAEAMAPLFNEAEISERLRKDPSSIVALVAQWSRESGARAPSDDQTPDEPGAPLGQIYRAAAQSVAPRLVIVVDQAEEALTLCHDESRREAFARALAAAGSAPDAPCRVVLSVREDFFGRLATLTPLRGLYSQVVEVVTTPDREALARTLYLPANHFGYAFEDESLVNTMVDTVASEPAALALLQFCADSLWEVRDRTWKRLSWEAYRALGGVEGALAAHADRTMTELSSAQERAAKSLLLRLVTAERTRATASRKELLEAAVSSDDTQAVLDRLIGARLLTVSESDDGSDARVEIVHEALIRHWGKLATWLSEDEEGQRLQHAMRQAARDWHDRGRARGLLWSGEALEDLRRWRKRSAEKLAGTESAFFAASEADERRGRRLRRVLSATAFVATGAFGAFMFWQWRNAENARVETERARVRAEARGLVSEARNQEPSGKTGKALALFRAAAVLENEGEATSATTVSLDMERLQRAGAASLVLAGHKAQVSRLSLSPDRQQIATASFDGTARLWNSETGQLLHVLEGHGHSVGSLAFSPDGKHLLTGAGSTRGDSGAVRRWDATTGKLERTLTFKSNLDTFALSPDGELLCAVVRDQGATLWSPRTGDSMGMLGEPDSGVEDVVFSADGKLIATRATATLRIFDRETRKELSTFKGNNGQILAQAFSPDGSLFAATTGGVIRLWDPRTGQQIRDLSTPDPGTYDNGKAGILLSFAFSPDGKWLAAGGMDHLVRVWETATGEVKHLLRRHKDEVSSVHFSPDGSRLASASFDGTAAVWDMASGALVEHLRGHEAEIYRVELVTASRLATVSYDHTARLWDVDDGPYQHTLSTTPGGLQDVTITPDGSRLAASSERRAWVIDTRTDKTLLDFSRHEGQVRSIAISADGTRVATGATDGSARLWSLPEAEPRQTLTGHEKGVSVVRFSRDGKRLFTGAGEGAVRVWDSDGGARGNEMKGHTREVLSLVLARGDTLLASASRDGTARLWELPSGKERHRLGDGPMPVFAVAFSPDEKTLATAQDLEVRLWDVDSGQPGPTLGGFEQAVLSLAFSPGGKELVGLASDGLAISWELPGGRVKQTLRTPVHGGYDVAFSPDGERLFVAGGEGHVFAWHNATGALLEQLAAGTRDPGRSVRAVFPLGPAELLTAAQDGSLLRFRSGSVDRKKALFETGRRTSYRVCRGDFHVVAVTPPAAPETVWAPDSACADRPSPGAAPRDPR